MIQNNTKHTFCFKIFRYDGYQNVSTYGEGKKDTVARNIFFTVFQIHNYALITQLFVRF